MIFVVLLRVYKHTGETSVPNVELLDSHRSQGNASAFLMWILTHNITNIRKKQCCASNIVQNAKDELTDSKYTFLNCLKSHYTHVIWNNFDFIVATTMLNMLNNIIQHCCT